MVEKVIKVNDSEQDFDIEKIRNAIIKANNSVSESSRMDDTAIEKVVSTVMKKLEGFTIISVEDIHDFVEQSLVRHNKYEVAKSYILYREEKRKNKKYTPHEEKCLSVINGTSELRGDNANKCIDDNGSIRDYIAGQTCKDLFRKDLPKHIVEAHDKGIIHWHDSDYSPAQPEHNCDLLNIEDMFTHGFQMQDTFIEPSSTTTFATACNLLAQVNLIVSGRQYGGQTISWSHLLPFIENSRKKIRKELEDDFMKLHGNGAIAKVLLKMNRKKIDKFTEEKLRLHIRAGIKTYQYQILCHSSANGQTPFVSNNLCLREAQTPQELKDFALLIEEILLRRIKGIKDKNGFYISPLFPKLLYWTCDGLNVKEGDPYFYLTQLAAQCELTRIQPDIVSEKQTRKVKKGQIIPSMGCRSLLAPIWEVKEYDINTKFYWKSYSEMLDDIYKNENVVTDSCYNFMRYASSLKISNMTRVDFENTMFPFGEFVDARDFKSVENGKYPIGMYRINFRGNTGWLINKSDDKVTILEPKVYGRWNNGVVTLNLPYVALEAMKGIKEGTDNETRKAAFFKNLDTRLELVHEALKFRYNRCREIKAKNSAILWQYGALARLAPDETVGDLMDKYPERASISVGFVGLYEVCRAVIGESNTSEAGRKFAKEVLTHMNRRTEEWKNADNINYSIYGTPEESLTYKFSKANRKDFGVIDYITDKDYVVNSYHVDPREKIDAFSKIEIEGEYLSLSSGGAVSYVEIPGDANPQAIISIIQWMHEHIVYAEFNKKLGICYKCGYQGDIPLIKTHNGQFIFKCPCCGNTDDNFMRIVGRICGYMGKINACNTNYGRLDDFWHRVEHLDCFEEEV